MPSVSAFFRKLILGNNSFILSHSQFKRVLLTGQLALITGTVCLGYLIYDLMNGVYHSWPFQLFCAVLSWVSFLINRRRKHLLAKIILGVAVNITVFIFASSEPSTTGLYSIYIPVCLGAMAGFGFEERRWALTFIIVSIMMCLISLFSGIAILPPTPINADYIAFNMAANLLISTLASVLILYFLITVNHHSEVAIHNSEQQLIRKNEELTKLNSELDRFVYSSSHDLRAPLTSVLGLIQLTELSENVDEIKSYTRLMKNRIEELDKFIHDISDYSRNARQQTSRTEVNMKRLVREVLESLRFYPGSEGIQIDLEIAEDQTILVDVVRLKMIISNLVSNSFKYSDPTKDSRFVKIKSKSLSPGTYLEIEDNGIGIPYENLGKIFDMFFQAHDTSVGSGLGLYIVKETIEKLGGRIQVESAVGEGSKFQIQLP